MAIRAVTAALQSAVQQDKAGAITALASPYLNREIHKLTEGDSTKEKATNLMAHALLSAVEFQVTGKDPLTGAIAGVTGEATAQYLTKALYNKAPSELTASEKETISRLSQLAGGLAGAFTAKANGSGESQGGSFLSGVAGAETAKRAVENNYLSSLDVEHFVQELEKAQKEGRDTKPIIEKYQKISAENRQELLACNGNVLCESGHLYQMNAGAEEVERNLGFFSRMTVPYPNNLNENNRILLSTLVEQENANSFNQLSNGTKFGLSAIELGAAIGGTGLITKDSLGKFKLSNANANSKLPVVGKTENYENQTSKIHISSGAENVALYPKLKKELAQQEKAGFGKVIKDLSVKPEGSVLLLPEYRQKLSDAKAGLPIKLQIKGNAAIAHIDVEGIQTKFLAGHSGIDTITGDFIGKGKTVFTSLTLPSKSGKLIDRKTDSEYKILSNLADQLGTNIGAKGQITIFTERPACKSCLGVAEQFNKRYPNIKVNIFDNNGNVVKPLNGEK